MRKFSFLALATVVVLMSTFFSCNKKDDNNPAPQNSIAKLAQGNPQLSILVKALQKANLVSVLDGTDKYTVFAPTNAAFAAAGITEAEIDAASGDDLRPVLLYHVLAGEKLAASLQTGLQTTATTADFKTMRISVSGGKVKVNGYSTVTTADIKATNGVIHLIDVALDLPADLVESILDFEEYSLLAMALTEAGLVDAVRGFTKGTIFAPNNDAFKAIGLKNEADIKSYPKDELTSILLYHVLDNTVYSNQLTNGAVNTLVEDNPIFFSLTNNGVFVNGTVKVTDTDFYTTNGTIHAIDKVLIPAEGSITDIVVASEEDGEFTLLLRAIGRVEGLADALATAKDGYMTVFAPTDAAFRAAGLTEEAIAEADESYLESVLLYHVLPSAVFSTDIKAGSTKTLLEGQNLNISTTGGVKVNDSNITKTNILATNGVIHVIDKVLIPNLK